MRSIPRPRLPLLALCCIAAPSSAESSLDSEALQAALSDVRAERPLGVYSLVDIYGIEGERVPLVPTCRLRTNGQVLFSPELGTTCHLAVSTDPERVLAFTADGVCYAMAGLHRRLAVSEGTIRPAIAGEGVGIVAEFIDAVCGVDATGKTCAAYPETCGSEATCRAHQKVFFDAAFASAATTRTEPAPLCPMCHQTEPGARGA